VSFLRSFLDKQKGAKNSLMLDRKLYDIAILPMGFAVVLNNGPSPEIVLAISRQLLGVLFFQFLDKKTVKITWLIIFEPHSNPT